MEKVTKGEIAPAEGIEIPSRVDDVHASLETWHLL
jgi:hypothetical protein